MDGSQAGRNGRDQAGPDCTEETRYFQGTVTYRSEVGVKAGERRGREREYDRERDRARPS